MPWGRFAQPRLMQLSRTGKRTRLAGGTVHYLLHLRRRARIPGRCWIELNVEPATVPAKEPAH